MSSRRVLKVKVTLTEYLDSIGVTKYTLSQWVEGVSQQTVYAVADGSRRPSLETLEALLQALHSHGFMAQLSDLLTVEQVPAK